MKKILITEYHLPDKTSLRTKDRKYSVMTDFNNHTFEFDTKKEVEDFLRKFSQDMTDLLFLYNESLARAFVAYRGLWFYMDDIEQSEINVNHECDGLVVSLTRLFDRITHWDHGGDAYRLTKDIRMIGQELKKFWKLIIMVVAKRSQWADHYRYKLEVYLVDNFREKLETMITPITDKPEVITYGEMEEAKDILNLDVNLKSDYQKKKFEEGLRRLRKQGKKKVINDND